MIRCVAAHQPSSIAHPSRSRPAAAAAAARGLFAAVTVDEFYVNSNRVCASVQARELPQITATTDDNQPRKKSVFDDMDPFPSTSFGELPPSACSTFSEDPSAAPADDEQLATADQPADCNWTSSSMLDAAAETTVTVDSKDMAFVLTKSSDALATDSEGAVVSTENDENGSKEVMNGEEPAAEAANDDDDDDDDAWHQIDDDDDEVRKTRIFRTISPLFLVSRGGYSTTE